MAFTSYTDFKATVASYLARDDLTSMIPAFITLAEARLGRDVNIREMLKVVTTTTTAGDPTVELPSDFSMIRDIHINTNPITVLQYDTPSAFYRNTNSTVSGIPRFYTILAREFQFSPIPDSAYDIQMLYYANPTPLSDTNASNIYLTACPDLLLYATLGEAEPYLMNDARLQTWATMYDKGLQSLIVNDDAGEWSGSPISIQVLTR